MKETSHASNDMYSIIRLLIALHHFMFSLDYDNI